MSQTIPALSHGILSYRVHETAPYINWIHFFHAWGFQPRFAAIADIHGCDSCRAMWLASFPEEERAKAKAEAEELVKGGEVKVENKETLKVKHEGGVVIEGASGLLVRIAKCCNPVPGDDIVGYITKGRGVAIHRVDCMNLRSQENYEQRLLDVEWEDQFSSKEYMAHIDIYGLNRSGLLNDILQVLSNTTKNISTVNAQPTKDMKFANIHVSFGISNLSMLTTVVDKIKSVPEVYSVKRTNG